MAADGNYLVVVHVKDQPLSTFNDTNLHHAKEDAHSRAAALMAAKVEFHVFVVTANNPDEHWLDVFTREGRIPGFGPVSVKR